MAAHPSPSRSAGKVAPAAFSPQADLAALALGLDKSRRRLDGSRTTVSNVWIGSRTSTAAKASLPTIAASRRSSRSEATRSGSLSDPMWVRSLWTVPRPIPSASAALRCDIPASVSSFTFSRRASIVRHSLSGSTSPTSTRCRTWALTAAITLPVSLVSFSSATASFPSCGGLPQRTRIAGRRWPC